MSDSVSGATPRYHSLDLERDDAHERQALSPATSRSRATSSARAMPSACRARSENDYDSTALSLEASFSSEDNNRTWNIGVGLSSRQDRVRPTTPRCMRRGSTTEFAGRRHPGADRDRSGPGQRRPTTRGHGYYSDPYKEPDIRPRQREPDDPAGALEPLLRGPGRNAALELPLLPRQLRHPGPHARRRVGAAGECDVHADALAAPVFAKRGLVLLRPGLRSRRRCALSARLLHQPAAVHLARPASVGIRRRHAGSEARRSG